MMMFGRRRCADIVWLLAFTSSTHANNDADDTTITPAQQLKQTSAVVNPEANENDSIAIACDFNNDPCTSQFDSVCEAGTRSSCPAASDCYDCDPCHSYHLDCSGCVKNGCVWCASDAFCSSAPLERPVWQRIEFLFHTHVASSCLEVDDWVDSCPTEDNVFTDPLYDAMQWAYDLLNVEPVWKRGIQGTGVRIRINDVGVDHIHPEFQGRFDISASCDNAYAARGFHGTAVASLVAGAANNDHCAVGIANNATLSACVMELQTAVSPEVLATVVDAKLSQMDISVNAWGIATCLPKRPQRRRMLQPGQEACHFRKDHTYSPCHFCNFDTSFAPSSPTCLNSIIIYCALRYEEDPDACSQYLDLFTTCGYNTLTEDQQQALARGVNEGRNGKGVIYVFSAGNSHSLGVDTNFDGWVNSRFTISVGAVGKDGRHASYSTTGAALFVMGPGGDRESLTNNIVAVPGGNSCGDVTVGTSFSAPYVAGVVALMLEVNPALTWRDVQGILAQTSTRVDDPEDDSWTTNGAGFQHSHKNGFGIPNAEAAVNAAETWVLWEMEQDIVVDSGIVNVSIADDPSIVSTSTISISATEATGIVVESVFVNLDLLHPSRGDLKIVLTSPAGTESILHPGKRPENTHLMGEERWSLMTVRNWGESAVGEWSISLVDDNKGVLEDCVDKPFQYVWADEDATLVWTCGTLEIVGACSQGRLVQGFEVNLFASDGSAAVNACCACGGGMPASTVNLLRSWELVVYGRERVTSEPSAAPSTVTPTERASSASSPVPESQSLEYDGSENLSVKSAGPSLFQSTVWFMALCAPLLRIG